MTTSIIQPWVQALGLRHQGVIVSAVRGCDGAEREDASKYPVRFYRACVLNAHCRDPRRAVSYMLWPKDQLELERNTKLFTKSIDHYPMHWLTHFMFAAEVTGYYFDPRRSWVGEEYHGDAVRSAPDLSWVRGYWLELYCRLVSKLHLVPETKEQLDARLNPDEEAFGHAQVA